MEYVVQFKPRALKDLKSLQPDIGERIVTKIEQLQDNLSGDVKKLTNFTPEYRCVLGNIAYYLKSRETKSPFTESNIEVTLTPKLIKTTIELDPNFLTQNGQKLFAILPYEEYLPIQEMLEDIEDLQDLRQAKAEEKDAPTVTLEAVKKQLQK